MFRNIKDRLDDPVILQLIAYSEYGESPERAARRAEEYREDSTQRFYGWVEGGEVLGTCAFHIFSDKVVIDGIAAAEHARRRGTGRAIVTALRKEYHRAIEAETDDDAAGFYRKCGFSVTEAPAKGENCRYLCVLPPPGRSPLVDSVIPLSPEEWRGYVLPFHYTSWNYYDVEIARKGGDFHVSFVKKPFDTAFEYKPEQDYDKLFAPHWEDVKAWGIVEEGRLIAAIETSAEGWSNRLRVTELWIHDDYRRMGIGTALMDRAMNRARSEGRRAVMLETQSRNENAVAFYLAYGFTLIGFDACCYRNDDLSRREVRMELGILFE